MKLAIGSDHGGFLLKKEIMNQLNNYQWIDCGTYDENSCDYPDYAILVGQKVANHECDYGIVICKSGIGVSIAANKVKGIRCALVEDIQDAILAKQHNNANVLALGADRVRLLTATQCIQSWLNASFLKGRHEKRVEKITLFEQQEENEHCTKKNP